MVMEMVFHLGVHGTDGDRLLKTLLNNRDQLFREQAEVVPPSRHRSIFEEAMMALNGSPATDEMQQIMLDAMLESSAPERVIMSTPSLLGTPSRMVGAGGLYPNIGNRVAALANLFPDDQAEFFIAIRNPAVMLTKVLPQIQGGYMAMMQGCHPEQLRWRDTIRRLVGAAQGRRVVVWCHEDVPMIWPELLRLAGEIETDTALSGTLLYMHELLTKAGIEELRAALGGRDQMSIAQRRSICAEILQTAAKPGALEETISLPGWTQETVDMVTDNYRADAAEIAALPGIEFIMP